MRKQTHAGADTGKRIIRMDNISTDNTRGFSVQVMQAGKVCVSPSLPFGAIMRTFLEGQGYSPQKQSGSGSLYVLFS